MIRKSCFTLALALVGTSSVFAIGLPNVLKGQPVTGFGTVTGTLPSVTDEVFGARGSDPMQGTACWTDLRSGVEITLDRSYEISSMIFQGEGTSGFHISYLGSDLNWHTAWDIAPSTETGLITRPDASDNTAKYLLPSPITTNLIRITGITGNDFCVSELQGFGKPTPEPATMAALGLGALALVRRRRASK